jgi:hypothetical protein
VRCVKSHDRVFVHSVAASPLRLAAALAAYALYYLGLAPELTAAWSLSPGWAVLFALAPLIVPASLLTRGRG